MRPAVARVLLTGATGGIGRAAADALLERGASLMLAGRSPATLSEMSRGLVHRMRLAPERIVWKVVDLAQPQNLALLAGEAASWGVNVVVHNAGTPAFGAFESIEAARMQQVLQTNLLAPMLLTQALMPHLRTLPKAQVVCMGSALGRIGLPGYSAYCASKFGLRGFAEALRRELGHGPIHIQYLGPRSTHTAFNNDEVLAYNLATGTSMDEPAIVAEALVRLIDDEAAERFLGFPEKVAVRINGIVPSLLDGIFSRHRHALGSDAATVNPDLRGTR